jgi:hypothetical protein
VYCVLSLIQITLAHNAEELARATRTSAAIYIACGIDPSKVTGSRDRLKSINGLQTGFGRNVISFIKVIGVITISRARYITQVQVYSTSFLWRPMR